MIAESSLSGTGQLQRVVVVEVVAVAVVCFFMLELATKKEKEQSLSTSYVNIFFPHSTNGFPFLLMFS